MRKKLSMNKDWKFKVHNDAEEKPYKYPEHIDFYRIKSGYEDGYASISYNDAAWESIDIPHDRLVDEEYSPDESLFHGGKIRGCYWYRKTFPMDEKYTGKHFFICFQGISCSSKIYFNGSLIKRSFSPYEEITIDVTDRMHFGKEANVLSVFVNGRDFDAWHYEGAGIYRDADLYIKDATHISHNGVFIKPVYKGDENWEVFSEITVENSSYSETNCFAQITLKDQNGNTVATEITDEVLCKGDQKTTINHMFKLSNPALWDINNPVLYTTEIALFSDKKECDSESVNTGFRYFRFDADTGFYLNGKNIKIKGAGVHQDHAGVGIAVPASVHDFRIRKLKEAGCNTYRCGHHPHPRAVYDACDRHGLLVLTENRHLETSDDNMALLENMVLRDRNHPSIIMYLLFNEEPLEGNIEGRRIFERMKSFVKKLDDSRAVSGAMHTGWFEPDGIATAMDVTGFNYSPEKQKLFHELYPDQPTIGSEEICTMATRGCYKTDDEKHIMNSMESERSYHGTIFDLWDFTRKNDFMSGIVAWCGFDYHGEPTPFSYPSISTQYGFMDLCGFPKTNYYYTQSCYSEEPMIHIEPHWNHNRGDIVKTKVITNCEETELFLNGTSLGRRPVDICSPNAWEIEFVEGTLEAKGYINGKEVLSTTRKTTGKPHAVKLLPDKTVIKNDGRDAVVINVCAVDETGTIIPDSSALINFEIDGDAKIIGVGNGDPNCHEKSRGNSRSLYNGYCQVIIQSNENASHITLNASSDDMLSDSLSFEIEKAEIPESVGVTDNRTLGGWTISLTDYEEEPDPTLYISDTDFNSIVPVIMNPNRYQLYTDCWKIYRVKIKLQNADGKNRKCTINMSDLLCESARGYANGRLVFEAPLTQNAPVTICFDTNGESEFDFRLHVEARKDSPHSGMRGYITLSVD